MSDGDLQAAVERARAGLEAAADGHLPRPDRIAVQQALGPDGCYQWTVLGVLAAERALPVWLAERPEDGRVELLLRAALSSPDTVEAARPRADELQRKVTDASGADELGEDPMMVAWAAVAAVYLAWAGELGVDDFQADDPDVDPDLWPPEYCAEMALTGYDPAERVTERRDYWRWWLDEAVPQAAQAGPRPE